MGKKTQLVDLVNASLEKVKAELAERKIDLSKLTECPACSKFYVSHRPPFVEQQDELGNYSVRRNGYEVTLSPEQMTELCSNSGLCPACRHEYKKGCAA